MRLMMVAFLLPSCGLVEWSEKRVTCPPMPTGFGLWVERVFEHETISVMIRDGELVVRGGEVGDLRSLRTEASQSDTERLEALFCDLERAKPQFESEVSEPTRIPRVRAAPGSGARTDEGSLWFLVSSTAAVVEIGERALEEWTGRLPPVRMPPLESYVSTRQHQCSVPPDFRYVEGWLDTSPRILIEADGRFLTFHSGQDQPTHTGRIPSTTLNAMVCELGRYDFSVLPVNDEGRSELCAEGVRHVYTPGIGWHYTGAPIDVRLDGHEWRLRVGRCGPPLNLHRFLTSLRVKALSLYVDR